MSTKHHTGCNGGEIECPRLFEDGTQVWNKEYGYDWIHNERCDYCNGTGIAKCPDCEEDEAADLESLAATEPPEHIEDSNMHDKEIIEKFKALGATVINMDPPGIEKLGTEELRMADAIVTNALAGPRKELEAVYGQVWDTTELQRDFTVIGFAAPYVVVTRKSDNKRGTLKFQHDPRFYFRFEEDK